jgi:hypothetical protein
VTLSLMPKSWGRNPHLPRLRFLSCCPSARKKANKHSYSAQRTPIGTGIVAGIGGWNTSGAI